MEIFVTITGEEFVTARALSLHEIAISTENPHRPRLAHDRGTSSRKNACKKRNVLTMAVYRRSVTVSRFQASCAASCLSCSLRLEIRFVGFLSPRAPLPGWTGGSVCRPVPSTMWAHDRLANEPEYSEKTLSRGTLPKALEEERPDALLVVDFGQLHPSSLSRSSSLRFL
jgi:hypothetical protein